VAVDESTPMDDRARARLRVPGTDSVLEPALCRVETPWALGRPKTAVLKLMESREMLAFGRFGRRENAWLWSVAADRPRSRCTPPTLRKRQVDGSSRTNAMAMLLDTESVGVAGSTDAKQRAPRAFADDRAVP